jgi:hypothetical protein
VVDPAAGINDFAGVSVEGKIAACKVGAPPAASPAAQTIHGDPGVQARAARDRGALGIVLLQSAGQAESTSFARIARAWRAPRLVLDDPAGEGRILALVSAGTAAKMLAGGGSVSLTIDSSAQREARWSDNVIGWLPGTDPDLKNEMVVVSAHLDHLGDDIAPVFGSGDKIANGALDNAIGVATMIEAARQLAGAPRKHRRGIVFVAFTAEEQGLLGSRWFIRQLPTMQRRTSANVNIDMPILLYPLSDLLISGSGWPDFHGASQLERQMALPIALDTETALQSDNLSFTRIAVPTYLPLPGRSGAGSAAERWFKTEHYHRGSDELALPIDWTSAKRYAQFVQLLTAFLANEPSA